jgi:hypothetical protein
MPKFLGKRISRSANTNERYFKSKPIKDMSKLRAPYIDPETGARVMGSSDDAPPHGIKRPDLTGITVKDDE